MIDVSFEINVRKVNSNNVKGVLESENLSQVAESVKKSVGNLRCAEHGHSPKIKVKWRNLKLQKIKF